MKLQSLIFLIILCSCTNRRHVWQEISVLQSKPISIPLHLQTSSKTNSNNYSDNKLRLIDYIDSTGCTSCNLTKMYLWDSIIEYSKKYNGRLEICFLYSPAKKDVKQIEMSIKNMDTPYSVFIDTLKQFEKLNSHLPKNKALHTFLLDENNNVILVGSPVNSKKVKELFYKIVEEKLGKPQALPIRDSIN